MKAVITADSHQQSEKLLKLIRESFADADFYLHAGDRDGKEYPDWICVSGNADEKIRAKENRPAGSDADDSFRIIDAGEHRILLLHGHQFAAKGREEKIAELARQKDCDIAVYGHSHKPSRRMIDGVLVINPGGLVRPAKGEKAGFMILDLDTLATERTDKEKLIQSSPVQKPLQNQAECQNREKLACFRQVIKF